MNITTSEKLDQLAELHARKNVLFMENEAAINRIIPISIQQELAAVKAEFDEGMNSVEESITELTKEIIADVLAEGKTVKGAYLQACWVKGRTSWDTSALDGYAAAHPEISQFKKIGAPSVSIRK